MKIFFKKFSKYSIYLFFSVSIIGFGNLFSLFNGTLALKKTQVVYNENATSRYTESQAAKVLQSNQKLSKEDIFSLISRGMRGPEEVKKDSEFCKDILRLLTDERDARIHEEKENKNQKIKTFALTFVVGGLLFLFKSKAIGVRILKDSDVRADIINGIEFLFATALILITVF